DFEMGNLAEGVNTCIRAPGAVQFHIPVKHADGRFTEFSHHRAGVFLLLPPAVTRAVVFEYEFEDDQLVDIKRTSCWLLILPALKARKTSIMELITGVRPPPPRPPPPPPFPERIKTLDSSRGR